jgi:hypothetical protein
MSSLDSHHTTPIPLPNTSSLVPTLAMLTLSEPSSNPLFTPDTPVEVSPAHAQVAPAQAQVAPAQAQVVPAQVVPAQAVPAPGQAAPLVNPIQATSAQAATAQEYRRVTVPEIESAINILGQYLAPASIVDEYLEPEGDVRDVRDAVSVILNASLKQAPDLQQSLLAGPLSVIVSLALKLVSVMVLLVVVTEFVLS